MKFFVDEDFVDEDAPFHSAQSALWNLGGGVRPPLFGLIKEFFMNEEERKEKGEETKEEGQGQGGRKRDTSDGIDLMLFHMICPPGIGGRVGKVE